MAWIESHQTLAIHRKTLAMSRMLGIKRATVIGHLHLLWWWCLDNAPNGNLSEIDHADIAAAMDWSGDSKTIIAVLKAVGFIDDDMVVHSWVKYAGKLITRREANAESQKKHREKQAQLRLSSPSQHDVITTSSLRKYPTVQYSTVPNPTKRVEKKKHGEFQNVLITDEEHTKLKDRFGTRLPDLIERLSEYKKSKGVSYKDDYATILSWARKEATDGERGNGRHRDNSTKLPQKYTEPGADPVLDKLCAAEDAAQANQ